MNKEERERAIDELREQYEFGHDPKQGLRKFRLRLEEIARHRFESQDSDNSEEFPGRYTDGTCDKAYSNPDIVEIQARELSRFIDQLRYDFKDEYQSRDKLANTEFGQALENVFVVLNLLDNELQKYIAFDCKIATSRLRQGFAEAWIGLTPLANKIDGLLTEYGKDLQEAENHLA